MATAKNCSGCSKRNRRELLGTQKSRSAFFRLRDADPPFAAIPLIHSWHTAILRGNAMRCGSDQLRNPDDAVLLAGADRTGKRRSVRTAESHPLVRVRERSQTLPY